MIATHAPTTEKFLHAACVLMYASPTRAWLRRELNAYPNNYIYGWCTPIHPGVIRAMDTFGRPNNWHQLLMEVPHIPVKEPQDPLRVAYTPNDAYGEASRQRVGALGKYLKRHWPHIQDHHLRDVVERVKTPTITIWDTPLRIVWSIEAGPRSCMHSSYGSIPFTARVSGEFLDYVADNPTATDLPGYAADLHPYAVYLPSMGWRAATLPDPEAPNDPRRVMSRALLWHDPKNPDRKVFVRTYRRNPSGDIYRSCSCTTLEALLLGLGYTREDSWPQGALMAYIEHPHSSDPMLPYLDASDADDRLVEEYHHPTLGTVLRRCSSSKRGEDGVWECSNTDGTGEHAEDNRWTCAACGTRHGEGEPSYSVGRHEDIEVGSCCIDDYTQVRGARSSGCGSYDYYIPSDHAEAVRDRHYHIDPDYTPEGVVELEDGTWADLDDTVVIDDEYYMTCDPRVVETYEEDPDTGHTYGLKDDCWLDAFGAWHQPHVEPIEIDGEKYHEDDCWQCAGDHAWYLCDDVEPVTDPETGLDVHPDWLAPINRDCMDESHRQDDLPTVIPTPLTPAVPRVAYAATCDEPALVD